MDWFSVSVDVLGIVGDVALGTLPLVGVVIWAGATLLELISLGKAWDDLEMGDPTGVVGMFISFLVKAGRLPPLVGSIASVVDLIYNLAKGFYWGTIETESEEAKQK